jgi:hypothetical protein
VIHVGVGVGIGIAVDSIRGIPLRSLTNGVACHHVLPVEAGSAYNRGESGILRQEEFMTITEKSEGYMRQCLSRFPEICRWKYGIEFNLAAVERKVRHLRRRTPLRYADLKYFESAEHWWFQRFWVFPPRNHIEPALKKETFNFWNLTQKNEADTIRRLLYIFKSIELVSIILRFIRPEHYGIYSSPVQHMLEIRRGRDLVETYLNYLNNLREIRKHYDFTRVADADMALWVLHEKCFGTYRDPKIEEAYRADDFMLQLRAKNLVAPLGELSDARLAGALSAVKPDIAAVIACYCFEIQVRKLALSLGLAGADPHRRFEQIIDDLPNYGPVDAVRKGLWRSLKSARNDLFHCGKLPGPRERLLLVKEVNRLEHDLDAACSP